MTPEAFFRICDGNYQQAFSTSHFLRQIDAFKLPVSETQKKRLALIMDEDLNDCITLDEYQNTLEAFNLQKEPHISTGRHKGRTYVPYKVRVLRDFHAFLVHNRVEPQNLYKRANTNNDSAVDINELLEVL